MQIQQDTPLYYLDNQNNIKHTTLNSTRDTIHGTLYTDRQEAQRAALASDILQALTDEIEKLSDTDLITLNGAAITFRDILIQLPHFQPLSSGQITQAHIPTPLD